MAPFGFQLPPLAPGFLKRRRKDRGAAAQAGPARRVPRGFEPLERREMLAADMAEIVGTVQVDLQGDGLANNDVVATGAQAKLYRDGGNGVFDAGAGDDRIAATAQPLDAQGKYRFEGIGAGKYFVEIALPGDLQFASNNGVREVTISASEAEGVVGRTIDDFQSTQRVSATPPLPSSDPSVLRDARVLGGERDLYVELTDGDDPFTAVSLVSGAGLLRLASDADVTGNAKIIWDGDDSLANQVNAIGLGGLDLTQFEGNTMTGISLTSGADHSDAVIRLRVYSDANNWSEFLTTVPETPRGVAAEQATFNFSDTPVRQSGSGASFSNVGALELTFEGVTAVDGQVSLVGLVGRTTRRVDFTAAPRLSLGDRVWADLDNNGRLDAGETGIDEVKLKLYRDTNDDNAYTAGVDQFLAQTVTSAGGRYAFNDLLPGNYVVMVDPMNFGQAMALEGMISSTGLMETDPDNDLDNDDNGLALTAAGVLSQAIGLAGHTEPTNDGDDDHNSNMTVDFGFSGFDVVLDKSVAQGAVSPGDQLDYTITVHNDGPSIARNVQFTDSLPNHVNFVSVNTTRPSVSLRESGGTITGGLGDLAAGDRVVITVVATVRSSATGVLVNEARVVADEELFLLNNQDQVENPVTPKIDLAIVKTESADPVEPGDVFTYTLDVINNGPSNATGVTVVDTLPEAGVTYQGSSLAPASTAGRELTFNLGNLDVGQSRSIDIDVRVDHGFVGTLLNQSRVAGNETETTYANNQDDEVTQVRLIPASVSGYVYVDRDDDGVFDPNEAPIPDVIVTLSGTDVTGRPVLMTTTTDTRGFYKFRDLLPGDYNLTEEQPPRFRDGKDTIGDNGDGLFTLSDGRVVPDLNDTDDRDADALEGIVLNGGNDGVDYNFGELAINVSKIDFLRPAAW
jgi:uncharacterized repeat protein (TIGR01451 family)